MPTLEKTIDTSTPVKLVYHATVHDLPSDERPRERLQHYGPQALSNAELLAIILRTGNTRDNVLELAGKLLAKYGGLGGLMRAEFGELCTEYGLGVAKASQLKAALEIGRRLGSLQTEEKYQITSPKDAANLVMMEMTYLDHEHSAIQVPVPITTFQSHWSLLEEPERLEQEYRQRLQFPSKPNEQERLDTQMGKLRRGLARLIDSYAEGLIDKQEFEPRVTRMRERLQHLKEEAEGEEELRAILGRLETFAAKVKDGLHDADFQTRRDIIRALVKRVEIDEQQIRVVFRISPISPAPPLTVSPPIGNIGGGVYCAYISHRNRDNQSTTYLFGSIQIRCVCSGRSKKLVEITSK
jgi:hypothetical protein